MDKCKHGAEMRRQWPEGLVVAAPVSTCDCCKTVFVYIDSGSYGEDEDGNEVGHETTWTPKNRCSECDGEYVRTEISSAPDRRAENDDE